MQYLEPVSSTPSISVYSLKGDYNGTTERFIVSTPQTRKICNCPEVIGCEYTLLMRDGMVSALKAIPFKNTIMDEPQESICILNFLRGGLNFSLREALNISYKINRHRTSFMTSQRFKKSGRWGVKENAYRKFSFPKDATILISDVVATGVTLDNGLAVLLEHLHTTNGSIKNIIFFTIGCHKIEKILDKYDIAFRELSKNYEGSQIVYFEGKFKLVDSKTKLKIGIPGTDLVRFDCVLTPEFEQSQYDKVYYPLERCTIYDAGSRAFDTPEYMEDLTGYWKKLKGCAQNGFTLFEALMERWPSYFSKCSKEFIKKSKGPTELIKICDKRLRALNKI